MTPERDNLIHMLRLMYTIRAFDGRARGLYEQNRMAGSFLGVPENTPEMATLIAEIARRSSVLLMHTVDQNAAHQMARYADEHPDLTIILAHAAHSDSDEAARMARLHANIYLDFACE